MSRQIKKGGLRRMSNGMKKFGTAVNNFLGKHGTTILTTVGIISEGIAIYEMYKATDDVKAKLEEVEKDIEYSCKYDHEEPPTKPQKLWKQTKAVAPVLAPTVIWFTFGAGCLVVSHKADSKKIAALTSAYELSETYRREYISKVKEKVGEKKAKEIDEEFYQEQAEKNMPAGPNDGAICLTGHGDTLYYDTGSGRFLRACPQWLEKCRVDISHRVFCDTYASVNDFYDILNIPTCTLGDDSGWESSHDLNTDQLIDMTWDGAGMTEWGEYYGFIRYWPKTRFRM